jgi:hypothetical protein
LVKHTSTFIASTITACQWGMINFIYLKSV